jgi:hypothetical protein
MSHILPQKVERIESPFIVACEGFGDVCLVEQLLKFKQIENCQVGCPSIPSVGGSGKDCLDKYLDAIALAASKSQNKQLRGLLVVVDADDDPQAAFVSACTALRFADYPVPNSPFVTIEENDVKSAVYLIPGENEVGTLEHLLLRSAFSISENSKACIDSFLDCIGKVPVNKPNVLAKMQMSALVAAAFPSNPWATPAPLLQSSKNDIVPIDSIHFKHLGDFLAELCKE